MRRKLVVLFLLLCLIDAIGPNATFAPTAQAQAAATAPQPCGAGYYRNASGICVRRPVRAQRPPAGATAQCRDGTYSFSQHHRGTCSHHGGVARWL
jgi:hypothetical protein